MNSFGDDLSYAVIGKAMEVHRELGPGLDESFYHEHLARKLRLAGIPHQVKPRGRLLHRGRLADEFEADLLIGDELVVELKVLWGNFAADHLLQVICYLKFWKRSAALLFDFGKESLVQKRIPGFDRTVPIEADELRRSAPAGFADTTTLDLLAASLRSVLEEHGLGYRDTTYRGLLAAELSHREVSCQRDPLVPVRVSGAVLGESRLPCLLLPGRCVLLVTALRDSRQAADRAVLQTCLKHLDLPWGMHVNFGKERLNAQFVVRPRTSGT